MNKIFMLVAISFFTFACGNEENNPAPYRPGLIPLKMEDVDGYRELIYDGHGKVTGLSIVTKFVDGTESKSIQTLVYNASGRLTESITDTGWRMVYHYDGEGRVLATEEYVNDVWSQRHTYTYNNKGLLKQSITYQNIPDEGGLIPVSKDEYTYDDRHNVTLQRLYYYTSYGADAKILTTFTFSDYDDQKNTEEYFDIHPFNPFVRFRKNNPGKMVVQNAQGIISSVETYLYEYNTQGFAVQKWTDVTMHNGSSGSYTTTYSFK